MTTITLTYADSSTWFAGQFKDETTANSWLDNEKTKAYWDNATTASVITTPDPTIVPFF